MTSLDMFVELYQFASEVLERQNKFKELFQFALEILEFQDKY
jgi:hypothetical protein